MFVFVLFALLSLAAAQCGDSCSCGNPACCQNPYASGSPYSVFGLRYGPQYSYREQCGPGQQYGYNQQCGSDQQYYIATPTISCLKVNPVPVSLTQLYQNQPAFTRVLPNIADNRVIDNICSTVFPLPDDSSTYLLYDSFVYCDGSHEVTTTIAQDIGTGTYLRGDAYRSFNQRIFASLGNNIIIGCELYNYEESTLHSVFVTTLGSVSPLGRDCIQQIQSVIQCVRQQPVEGLYVLPFRLPTRCVTQQVCSVVNPLLYFNNNNGFNECSNGKC